MPSWLSQDIGLYCLGSITLVMFIALSISESKRRKRQANERRQNLPIIGRYYPFQGNLSDAEFRVTDFDLATAEVTGIVYINEYEEVLGVDPSNLEEILVEVRHPDGWVEGIPYDFTEGMPVGLGLWNLNIERFLARKR